MAWSEADIPDLSEKLYVITGANSGIGLEAARMLSAKGARVIMACRTVAKGEQAAAGIRAVNPGAKLTVMALDLADLDSVRAFADGVRGSQGPITALINNAGVMDLPYQKTAQGFEMQLGTNHFGHFALTARVLDRVTERIVNVSSMMHRAGSFDWTDLNWERSYSSWPAYGRSKLANIFFTFELDRRLKAAGSSRIALSCHPGYAATNLQGVGAKQRGSALQALFMQAGNVIFAQPASWGALPTVYAAVVPGLTGGEFIGPRIFGVWGAPTPGEVAAHARDPEGWGKLWEASLHRTGVSFGV